MNRPPERTASFMDSLAAAIPEAGEIIRARRREQRGEILPYAEMEDLTVWIGRMNARSRGSGPVAERAGAVVDEFLQTLEGHFEVGDQNLDNLIAIGFLEGLRATGQEFPSLRTLLPRRMSAWFALACE